MKINSVFIANIAEIASSLTRFMTPAQKEAEIFEDHAYSDRFLFTQKDNRLLITPLPLNPEFVTDTCQLLGFKNTHNLWPRQVNQSICDAIFKDRKLLKQLTQIISSHPAIEITSYAVTPEFVQLVNYLKKQNLKFHTPEMPQEDSLWTVDFFGSKCGFRQAFSSQSTLPATPRGMICNSKSELAGWTGYFLQNFPGCVIKANRGLAGAGLHIIKKSDLALKKISSFTDRLVKKEPFWFEDAAVAEEYIPPLLEIAGGAPSAEVKVTDTAPIFLYSCGMRISPEGVFHGTEMGKDILPPKLQDSLTRTGKTYGRFLHQLGYRGFFDIDFVLSRDKTAYPVESNLRRTGGTHAYEASQRLLGNDFLHHYCVLSLLKVATPRFHGKDYSQVKRAVRKLLFPTNKKKEGVILTITSYLSHGKLGFMVIGPTKNRAYQIESEFLKLANSS